MAERVRLALEKLTPAVTDLGEEVSRNSIIRLKTKKCCTECSNKCTVCDE